jgi:hypothetical protein
MQNYTFSKIRNIKVRKGFLNRISVVYIAKFPKQLPKIKLYRLHI